MKDQNSDKNFTALANNYADETIKKMSQDFDGSIPNEFFNKFEETLHQKITRSCYSFTVNH